ncbi:protein-glutamate O-methyltransferase CheR [Sphingomonas ginkgonis]|uniref:protein-glutamate O-methyltransferase n=1 Tax=Sphingomonas ginkgonis TaxID=2315330 RepID=A0A429V9S5_9SPHN|nr:protein-glutamate O-methyltransferase CheR [Sphingomonas ginkgonis]RST30731.1 protein-glutamate O-methyltransferase CheR [Sphingomonas ginkgonis]
MELSDSSTRILAGLLEARTGQQLTMNRRWRLETALSGLLRERGIATIDELITILVMGREPGLANQVVEALLNNETYFFRDRSPFDLLARHALPLLRQARAKEKRVRIWSAGCSTGQEVYSMAMLFAEEQASWAGWTVDILGTDVSQQAIDRAREGVYSQFEVQRGLAITQTIKWFAEQGSQWRAADSLRKSLRFQTHNILEGPPHPGGFDIILCRNVLLYLSPETRRKAFDRLSSALVSDGWLMLGAGETVIGQTDKLLSDKNARGLYVHAANSGQAERRAGRG